MAVRAAVEIVPPPDIHLVNGEAVGAETVVGIALPLLERCDTVMGGVATARKVVGISPPRTVHW